MPVGKATLLAFSGLGIGAAGVVINVLIEVAWGHGTGIIQDGDAAEGDPTAHGIRRVGDSTGEAIGPQKRCWLLDSRLVT